MKILYNSGKFPVESVKIKNSSSWIKQKFLLHQKLVGFHVKHILYDEMMKNCSNPENFPGGIL